MACQIKNIDYLSLSDAAKSLKQSPSTIKKRCELKEYPNYLFLTGKVQVERLFRKEVEYEIVVLETIETPCYSCKKFFLAPLQLKQAKHEKPLAFAKT